MANTPSEIAQQKIVDLIKKSGKSFKDIAEIREMPYSSVREALKKPGRLTVDSLVWYAEFFGVPVDYLLSEDIPAKEIGENFKIARDGAEISFADAQKMLGVTSYMLDLIEKGLADATVSLLRRVVEQYRVSPDFILFGTTNLDNNDIELINALFKDVRFLLTCQDIQRRPDLKTLFSKLRRLSDDELRKLTQIIDDIINLFLKV